MRKAQEPSMPVDPDAEEIVLAYALSDPIGRADLLAALTPVDFAEGSSRGQVWAALQAVAAKHGAVSLLEQLVHDWLRQNDPDAEASVTALQEARFRIPVLPIDPAGTVRMELAATVRRLARQRWGIKTLSNAYSRLYERSCDPATIVASLGKVLSGHADAWRDGTQARVWHPTVQSASDLMSKDLPAVRWVVENLYPEGVTLLAAKPKQGKSAMMLHVGAAIAGGTKAMGHFETTRCDVLYMGLEDNERRMQKRLRNMLEGRSVSEGLHFVYEWPPLDRGGLEALDAYLDAHPKIGVVIIDTLEHVRPRARATSTPCRQRRI